MISEISFGNYRLFKGQSSISLAADGRTTRLLSNGTVIDDVRVLKSLAIYGPNNSGKSNLFHLFGIFKAVLSGQMLNEINRDVFDDNPLSSFSITFNNNDGKGWMRYEFSFDSKAKRFKSEKLSTIKYYSKGTPFEKVIFEKDLDGRIFKVFGEDCAELLSIIPSKLPILYSIELGSGRFAPLSEWLASLQKLGDSIVLFSMYNIPFDKTIEALKGNDPKKRAFISSFVKDSDLSIDDFEYQKAIHIMKDGQEIDEKSLSGYEKVLDAFHLSTTYGKKKVPSMVFDSSGTKKMESIASYVYDAIEKGQTLVVDELDNGLHFRLTRAIVSAFNNLANDKGQLLFTAHDLMLIDCKMLLRKDQICFLERNKETASLFCLKNATVSSGGPREGSDLVKRYNEGEFGALPTPSFVQVLLDMKRIGE